jgi:hypothetical protein
MYRSFDVTAGGRDHLRFDREIAAGAEVVDKTAALMDR